MTSRFFQCWKFMTTEKVVVKLPFHSLKALDLTFNKMEHCAQGNQIILTFDRKPKELIQGYVRYEGLRTEHSDKTDPIWR